MEAAQPLHPPRCSAIAPPVRGGQAALQLQTGNPAGQNTEEISLQTSSELHARLDRSTKPSVQPAANRLPRPRERDGAGEAAATPEAGDGGLEPRILDQAEHHLQQGKTRFHRFTSDCERLDCARRARTPPLPGQRRNGRVLQKLPRQKQKTTRRL